MKGQRARVKPVCFGGMLDGLLHASGRTFRARANERNDRIIGAGEQLQDKCSADEASGASHEVLRTRHIQSRFRLKSVVRYQLLLFLAAGGGAVSQIVSP